MKKKILKISANCQPVSMGDKLSFSNRNQATNCVYECSFFLDEEKVLELLSLGILEEEECKLTVDDLNDNVYIPEDFFECDPIIQLRVAMKACSKYLNEQYDTDIAKSEDLFYYDIINDRFVVAEKWMRKYPNAVALFRSVEDTQLARTFCSAFIKRAWDYLTKR